MAQFANTRARPTPLTMVLCVSIRVRGRRQCQLLQRTLVSGFLATTSKVQYPTWPKYIARTYTAIVGTEGDIEAGCKRVISPVLGEVMGGAP